MAIDMPKNEGGPRCLNIWLNLFTQHKNGVLFYAYILHLGGEHRTSNLLCPADLDYLEKLASPDIDQSVGGMVSPPDP